MNVGVLLAVGVVLYSITKHIKLSKEITHLEELLSELKPNPNNNFNGFCTHTKEVKE